MSILSASSAYKRQLPPVASFTVSPNPATGNPAGVTLTDTSTNNPTLIEWDFTNNGSYDASGVGGDSRVQNYTPGSYTILMRATNAFGSSTTTRSLTVNSPAFVGTPYNFNGGLGITVSPQPDTSAQTTQGGPIYVSASALPTATVTVAGSPVSGFSWSSAGTNTYQLVWPLPDTANFTLARNGSTMAVTATTAAGSNTQNFTLIISPRTVPGSFRWYANTGALTSGSGTGNATVARGAATVYLASSVTGNYSNPRATSISVVSGTAPPGLTLVSLADWNAGASSTTAFSSQRVKITNNATTPTAGTYSFTLRVNWDNNSVVTPDFTDYILTLTVT